MKTQDKPGHIISRQFQGLTLELRHNPAGATGVLPLHSHEEYQFILSEHMTGEYLYRRTRHVAPAASLLIIHPDEVHSARGLEDAQPRLPLRTFYVHPVFLKRIIGEGQRAFSHFPFFPNPALLDVTTFASFLRLHRLLEGSASTLEWDTVTRHTFMQLVQHHAEKRPVLPPLGQEHRAVQRARAYLHAHYADNVPLARLAEEVGLSGYHLCRVFCRDVGLPPHTYQTQQRIRHAKILLAQGNSIGTVAHQVGFADQAHFTRKFKRLVGVTPGNYSVRSSCDRKNVQDEDGLRPPY